VEIDQPGRDEQPAHINGLGAAGGQITPDFSYSSVAEGDVGHLVASACWVDNTAACEDQIPHVRASLKPGGGTGHDAGVGGGRRGQCSGRSLISLIHDIEVGKGDTTSSSRLLVQRTSRCLTVERN
jgi:hypothetical protein